MRRLRNLSYKPGSAFYVQDNELILTNLVPDVDKPWRLVQESTKVPLHPTETILEAARRAIEIFERHEIDEWFREDGQPVFQSHVDKLP